ncbi:MAG: hypothetical protein KUG81_11125 [Gammaproteobacteria bacterium]|nr:hypothetical protein [Gammaproteobacteria bacterium]
MSLKGNEKIDSAVEEILNIRQYLYGASISQQKINPTFSEGLVSTCDRLSRITIAIAHGQNEILTQQVEAIKKTNEFLHQIESITLHKD